MTKVGIVDYGAGNIASVQNAVNYAGGHAEVLTTPEAILKCDRLILPGVGAAGEALACLRERHLLEALHERVYRHAMPFLGICLGMQLLGNRLYEFGQHSGLGWISGEVISLKTVTPQSLSVPHMGWNEVVFRDNAKALTCFLSHQRYFYFSHSFTFTVSDPDVIAATVYYGVELVAAIRWHNVFATQFHPEKSQAAGNGILRAFLQWSP